MTELEFIKKIKEFKKKFFHGEVVNVKGPEPKFGKKSEDTIMWSSQHLPDKPNEKGERKVQYWPPKFDKNGRRELTEADLSFHFSQKPRKTPVSLQSGIGCIGKFEGNIAKWFVVDCDNQKAVDTIREKFVPILEKYSIDYIWEFSGTDKEEKAHVWFMCDCVNIDLLRPFVEQLFEDADINYKDRELGLELFPTVKGNNVIRLPGCVHLKTREAYSIIYNNKIGSSAEFILDSFIAAKPVTEDHIKSVLRPKEKKPLKQYEQYKPRRFMYNSRNLTLPPGEYPPVLQKVGSNCQAVQKLLWETKTEKVESLINDRTGAGHIGGKYLWNLAIFNDARARHNSRIKNSEGYEWIKNFTDELRTRDWEQHGWEEDREAILQNPDRYFPTCEAFQKYFEYCEGCPFKDKIKTPKEIWNGFPIKKRLEREVRLCSAEEIRQDTFKQVKAAIFRHLENGERKDILLASPQGSGKSFSAAEIAVELANNGKTVLMAVPTADIAMQYKNWISQMGQKAFVVMSHEKLFDKLNPGFDCPKGDEIHYLYGLGLSSGAWKSAFCKKCPLLEQCPYPNQYKKINELEHRIIIIQHAHFTCRETLYSIMMKKYDVMFIDEAFIDSCHKRLMPTKPEIEILDTFRHEIDWVDTITTWLNVGGYPKKEGDRTLIRPTEVQLELIKNKMEELRCPWNLPDYVRYFNINMYLEKHQGFHIFYPLPEVPVRVFTDATPPIEYLKIVLDNNDIDVYGQDEVLDFRKLNPNNKLIQCLDSSVSKSSLKGLKDEYGEYQYERFCEILLFIIDKIRNEYKDQKVLITTYCDGAEDQFKTVALNFLKHNLPEIEVGTEPPAKICISHMMIGTNKFADYQVQFLLAGVYRNGKQLKHEVYKLRSIANFWNRLKDRPVTPNPFPYGVGDEASIEREEEPVRRILPIANRAAVFAYDMFKYRKPADPDFNIIEKFAIAKTQQAIRLRFTDNRPRVVYVLGNYFLPSFLVTDSIMEDELISEN